MRQRALLFALLAALGAFLFAGTAGAAGERDRRATADDRAQPRRRREECIHAPRGRSDGRRLPGGTQPDPARDQRAPLGRARASSSSSACSPGRACRRQGGHGRPGPEDQRRASTRPRRPRPTPTGVLAEYQRQLADARTRPPASSRRPAQPGRRRSRRDLDRQGRGRGRRAAPAQRRASSRPSATGAMGELQGQVAALAIELAEKVVESNLDRETNTAPHRELHQQRRGEAADEPTRDARDRRLRQRPLRGRPRRGHPRRGRGRAVPVRPDARGQRRAADDPRPTRPSRAARRSGVVEDLLGGKAVSRPPRTSSASWSAPAGPASSRQIVDRAGRAARGRRARGQRGRRGPLGHRR